ncbi:hypothetical protein [Nocardia beijingensis]|uniref:Uncharacterized protein n=1 Tax=Nocardia beijingensis TaxID=95162 RepID=A0ABW7WHU6_9NOCA
MPVSRQQQSRHFAATIAIGDVLRRCFFTCTLAKKQIPGVCAALDFDPVGL